MQPTPPTLPTLARITRLFSNSTLRHYKVALTKVDIKGMEQGIVC